MKKKGEGTRDGGESLQCSSDISEREWEGRDNVYKVFRTAMQLQRSLPRLTEPLSQSTPLEKSCVCRDGPASINSSAKLLDWCRPLEVRIRQECGCGSRIAMTWALNQLCSLKQEIWAVHFHGCHVFPSDLVVSLHIYKGHWLARQHISH